ncbi:MAG: glycine--tRNA ligase subunit beta, partial [Gammaproteobacteria bacterium]|nr:glycine--tRNA ligase subunit beta [Gammaproteobacteria bacterium]
KYQWYATPRRLAVVFGRVMRSQPDHEIVRRGPALSAAYDESGAATRAATGFAQSCGVAVDQLQTIKTDKGEWLSYNAKQKGKSTIELLPEVIRVALAKLPIPKRMRWGDGDDEFVRPVHWMVVLLGNDVVPCSLLGVTSEGYTRGHRFHHPKPIKLSKPKEYAKKLKSKGFVIADFEERKESIKDMTNKAASSCGGRAIIDPYLLNEVTSLVEWPVVVTGTFDDKFLDLPREVLVASMQDQQKYFPVVDENGALLPYFIAISNIESKSPDEVVRGNERVIRPRLEDAVFFWARDCAKPFADYSAALKDVVFQKELGSLYDKTQRVKKLSVFMAERLDIDQELVSRAASLAKCDLVTDMVGEFPELQGIMGRYYAHENNESKEVAMALAEHYLPKFAGDDLPTTGTGKVLAIADKLDTLVGIFSIGKIPTGEKDPFGLRRAALGCLRIMIECELDLDLETCLIISINNYNINFDCSVLTNTVFDFMMERLRRYYDDTGIRTDIFESVLALRPTIPYDFHRRVNAVSDFSKLPEAKSLASANKRIKNILKQADSVINGQVKEDLLHESAEKQLHAALNEADMTVQPLLKNNDYGNALFKLAALRDTVDAFFDNVMVMCEDDSLKNNRIALLHRTSALFLSTADISILQPRT